LVSSLVGCSFCSIGVGIFNSKPDEKNKNPKQGGIIFMVIGGLAIVASYIIYLITKTFKGAGTAFTALTAYDILKN